MKTILFKNQFNQEILSCRDINQVTEIDGVSYLLVQRQWSGGPAGREFLMRKDSLKPVKDK